MKNKNLLTIILAAVSVVFVVLCVAFLFSKSDKNSIVGETVDNNREESNIVSETAFEEIMSSPIEEKCEFFESWKEEFIAVKDYVLSLGLKESQFDIAFDGEMVSDEVKYRYDSLKQHGLTSLWFVYDSVRDMSWVIFHARSETGRDVGILWRENDFPYYYDEQEIADHWYSYKEGLKNTQRRIRNIFEDCQGDFIIVKDYVLSLGLKENKNNVVPYGETVSDQIKQSYENLKQHGLSALEFVYNPERNISWLRFHMSNTETDRSGIVWREHEHIYDHDYEEEIAENWYLGYKKFI